MGPNPASIDKVFFSADLVSGTSRHTYPGGCGVLTLEEFEKFKMAANMAALSQGALCGGWQLAITASLVSNPMFCGSRNSLDNA